MQVPDSRCHFCDMMFGAGCRINGVDVASNAACQFKIERDVFSRTNAVTNGAWSKLVNGNDPPSVLASQALQSVVVCWAACDTQNEASDPVTNVDKGSGWPHLQGTQSYQH